MDVLLMIPAQGWTAVYLDEEHIDRTMTDSTAGSGISMPPPLRRVPLVCWAYVEKHNQFMEFPDTRVERYQHIVGLEAVIGLDGNPQVMPCSGIFFVGYLHESQELERLHTQAQLVWDVSQSSVSANRHDDEDHGHKS